MFVQHIGVEYTANLEHETDKQFMYFNNYF